MSAAKSCVICGCTEDRACLTEDGPCAWSRLSSDDVLVCTGCEGIARDIANAVAHFDRYDAPQVDLEKPYPSLNENCRAWVVVATGCFGFRYGPYSMTEAGQILSEGVDRGLGLIVSVESGPVFDWELAEDCAPKFTRPLPTEVVKP